MQDPVNNKFQEYFKNLVLRPEIGSKSLRIVVGYSGGLDSSVLLHLLSVYQGPTFEVVGVLHIDHNLREESFADSIFSEEQAKSYGFPFYKLDLCPIDFTVTNEVWGREVRYSFYEERRQHLNADYIVTAHHLDDEIETFLFKLLFGRTGPNLSLVQEFDKERRLLRPLISITKLELLQYAKNNNISYVEDYTNLDSRITRNNIRNNLMPAMEVVNPLVREPISAFIKAVRGDQEYITKVASSYLDKDLSEILLQDDSLAYRVFILLARKSLGELVEKLSQRRFKDLLCFLRNKPAGEVLFDLGLGVVAVFDSRDEGAELEFLLAEELHQRRQDFLKHETVSQELILGKEHSFICPLSNSPIVIGFVESSGILQNKISENSLIEEVCINGDNPRLMVSGRTSAEDFMLNGVRRKRLSRYLKEMRIPYKKRKSLFYIMNGKDLVWIPTVIKPYVKFEPDWQKYLLYYRSCP